ncbi:hypothetical protein H5410_002570 [Solanum commersonii]|uniref:Uncharacterized protein n=1 Tax=Solanum commersonii TaxID=4109 RepID=A0A9J6B261_SOLCO|nr:hypothetical protein H5410_002570 [Solanum commersonii]
MGNKINSFFLLSKLSIPSIMAVAEFVVAGGDYMGVWVETPKSWNWKSFSKTTMPIALHRNGSYDDMIASVI